MDNNGEVDGKAVRGISDDEMNGDSAIESLNSTCSGSRDSHFSPKLRPCLQYYNSAPVKSNDSNLLCKDQEATFSRLKTDKREGTRSDLMLDMLSESEKEKIIEDLVKYQKNGIVEVNVVRSAPVATELLKLDASCCVNEHFSSFFEFEDDVFGFNKSIPRLKIAMLVVGTRGDIQPFIAFAKRLQEFGHHVRLATHVNFRNFVRSAGVDFYPLGGDPRIMAGYMARSKGYLVPGPSEMSIQRKQLKEIINSLLSACTEPDLETCTPFKAEALIANPPAFGHLHVAEALGLPLHIFFTMPWTPTTEFPHPLVHVPQSAANRLSYLIVDLIVWWGIRGYINEFRKRKLKLPPIAYFSTYHGSISHLPTGYFWSNHLVPKPSDWGPLVDVVGYSFLDLGTRYHPSKEFERWFEQGSKPIYIGFGSMSIEDTREITSIILEALRETGQRGIIARGWGDFGSSPEVPSDIFFIDDCPHDWLFPRCAAVVHHGGAGTTAAGLRAGCPTTVVPFFGDQFFWGERILAKGVGPPPIPISELCVDRLSNAIRFMLEPEVKLRAMELGKQIENEDGVEGAVNAFHRHLPTKLPIAPTVSNSQELPHPVHWLLTIIEKWCCLPFTML